MPKLYMVSDGDGRLYVPADNFGQAIERWRDGWNKRAEEDGDGPYLQADDEPEQVVLIAEEDELYIPEEGGDAT